MKGWLVLGVVLLVLAAVFVVRAAPPEVAAPAADASASSAAGAACAGHDPKEGVYHPDRLIVRNPCLTVTGTVRLVRAEPDGDYHIRLVLDPPYAELINDRNRIEQQGALVVEIVCDNPVSQQDAVATCASVASALRLPPPSVGAHISVTGPYVLDTSHGWMEVHPLYEYHSTP